MIPSHKFDRINREMKFRKDKKMACTLQWLFQRYMKKWLSPDLSDVWKF